MQILSRGEYIVYRWRCYHRVLKSKLWVTIMVSRKLYVVCEIIFNYKQPTLKYYYKMSFVDKSISDQRY